LLLPTKHVDGAPIKGTSKDVSSARSVPSTRPRRLTGAPLTPPAGTAALARRTGRHDPSHMTSGTSTQLLFHNDRSLSVPLPIPQHGTNQGHTHEPFQAAPQESSEWPSSIRAVKRAPATSDTHTLMYKLRSAMGLREASQGFHALDSMPTCEASVVRSLTQRSCYHRSQRRRRLHPVQRTPRPGPPAACLGSRRRTCRTRWAHPPAPRGP
jgi:hypothetical protein